MRGTTILKTIHGSHLYGLAHAESDRDVYTVVRFEDPRYKHFARQSKGDDDRLLVSLDRFIDMVGRGVPQALEALHSSRAVVDSAHRPLLRALRPDYTETLERYRRTVWSFAHRHGGRTGSARGRVSEEKLRRHSLRLLVNLEQFAATRQIVPELTAEQVRWVCETAESCNFSSVIEGRLAMVPARVSASRV